jgi:hypothetical protein
MEMRECLIDFLRGLLRTDPMTRWTAPQAARHPFVTGEPYLGPYEPEGTAVRSPYVETHTHAHIQTDTHTHTHTHTQAHTHARTDRHTLVCAHCHMVRSRGFVTRC